MTPPPAADFKPEVIYSRKRDGYETRKILLNISAFNRIPAYLLVPEGKGPFPAIILMHDHGAHYSIGKEKVVEPVDAPAAVYEDAKNWIGQYYEGRWVGDFYAKNGYVVLAIDALFWGNAEEKRVFCRRHRKL